MFRLNRFYLPWMRPHAKPKEDTGFEGRCEITVAAKDNRVSLQFSESIKHFEMPTDNAKRIGAGIINIAEHIDADKIQIAKSVPRLVQ